MLGAQQAGLNTGRHALTWVLGQTHVWYLLYRCAHYVSKAHDQDQSSVSILNSLFSLDEDSQDLQELEENYQNQQTYQGKNVFHQIDFLIKL
ncbi:hypothetical protein QE152_g8459 [Popillia japonica]|uniref:Uncharacterized protein n=1 Tax=Popillia japonica TaxID=7064 RepID=A0AAW1MBQ7_POPJA